MLRAQAPSHHTEKVPGGQKKSLGACRDSLWGAGIGGQGWGAASSSSVFLLPPNLPSLGAGLLAETPSPSLLLLGGRGVLEAS